MTTPASRLPKSSSADSPSNGSSVSLRSVAVPSEHGGWSLTAEPAVLGLIVAWSAPGLALGVAAMLAFIARTPLKLVLADRFRHRWLDRTTLAVRVAAVELTLLVALVLYAVIAAKPFWLPFLVAAPLIGLELWFDMRSRGRRLIPELAGSIGIGSVATAIALAGDASTKVAWGLWVVIAARSLAAIPYVRNQILRTKAKPLPNWHSDTAQLVAVVGTVIGRIFGLVPTAAVIAMAILALINVGALRLGPRPAKIIGIQQMVFGIAVILTTAIAVSG